MEMRSGFLKLPEVEVGMPKTEGQFGVGASCPGEQGGVDLDGRLPLHLFLEKQAMFNRVLRWAHL
jgi:hypothetical protein